MDCGGRGRRHRFSAASEPETITPCNTSCCSFFFSARPAPSPLTCSSETVASSTAQVPRRIRRILESKTEKSPRSAISLRQKLTKTIDAHGRVVTPGFIDMLGQSDITILVDPHLPSKIFQGITTEITGEGGSIAPLNEQIRTADRAGFERYGINPDWDTLGQYFTRLEKQGIGINVADYVGATQVRRMVIGESNRPPTSVELDRMKQLVREAMRDGAIGLAHCSACAPAPYATTEELVALASEVGRLGGIYATHLRSEGDAIIPAIDEAIRIGREAKIPVEIWHLKAAGKPNWGRMPEIVKHIQQARDSGIDISANTYAYPAWFNTFSAFIPPWAHDGGDDKLIERLKDPATRARIRKDMETSTNGWDNEWQEIPGPEAILLCVVQNPKLVPLQGKTIAEIATLWKKDPIDTICDLLIEDKALTSVAVFGMSEPDVLLALQQPWTSIDNDSQGTSPDGVLGKELPHPRAYGTFPRILRKYVREEHKLTLEDAIRKFTALPASACASPTADCSSKACAPTSLCSTLQLSRTVRPSRAEPTFHRYAICARKWSGSYLGRENDQGSARKSAQGAGCQI